MNYRFDSTVVFAAVVKTRVVTTPHANVHPRLPDEDAKAEVLVVARRDDQGNIRITPVKHHGVRAQLNARAAMVAVSEVARAAAPSLLAKKNKKWVATNIGFVSRLDVCEEHTLLPGVTGLRRENGTRLHVNCRGNFFFGEGSILLEDAVLPFPEQMTALEGWRLHGWKASHLRFLKKPPYGFGWWLPKKA